VFILNLEQNVGWSEMYACIYFKLGFINMALCKLFTLLCMTTELLILEYMSFVLDF
jgi:hypothetical protein